MLGGFLPFGVNELTHDERQSRGLVVMNTATNFFLALIALWKGKARTAVFGTVIPFVALIGAVRLARPGSPYAKRFYAKRPRSRAKAGLRAFHHDRRWASPRRKFENFIGGTPDQLRAVRAGEGAGRGGGTGAGATGTEGTGAGGTGAGGTGGSGGTEPPAPH